MGKNQSKMTTSDSDYNEIGDSIILPQRGSHESTTSYKDVPRTVNVSQNVRYIFSGTMNGCTTVVVFWDKYLNTNEYKEVRANHASGSPHNIDWDGLLGEIKPSQGDLHIVIAPSVDGDEKYACEALIERGFKQTPVILLTHHALVFRDGTVIDFVKSDNRKQYQTRFGSAKQITPMWV